MSKQAVKHLDAGLLRHSKLATGVFSSCYYHNCHSNDCCTQEIPQTAQRSPLVNPKINVRRNEFETSKSEEVPTTDASSPSRGQESLSVSSSEKPEESTTQR